MVGPHAANILDWYVGQPVDEQGSAGTIGRHRFRDSRPGDGGQAADPTDHLDLSARPGDERDVFRTGPYVLTRGRTRPTATLDMMSLIRATDRARTEHLGITHAQALRLCRKPVSVAEVAAGIGQTLAVAKVILSDLIELGAVIASSPPPPDSFANDPEILKAVLDGLRNLK
jgi:hypothetical protein